ncbi:zinc-dependent alcohol dehydrogenase [Pseudonocardia kunmingensis]|uniref:Threonine dehydrogenase-like Zn-dependent dehydrogenase n=1 Tax=Pseudonocardia kunmingensis TaxID=630975 RepID=A0A543DNV9_9PSEU|nr:alcohol dehydrogenase catalytic domain-containing protein [Pseudonocardia kunmingensis]TQM10973.1 threonine dehydrogenase-like Zn-dependent dehydrogenase [Pseudonocardia kunmingensis]
MRALVLSDFWKLTVDDVPEPQPGPGDVLIEVLATGICGSDIHGYTGENGRRIRGQVMGHETVGRVLSVGAEAGDGIAVGDAVTVNPVLWCGRCRQCAAGREQACPDKQVVGVTPALTSAFAERMAVPARNAVRLPDGMPVEHGALVEPLAVGYHALVRGGCGAGDAVLVLGGGPIGQACVLAAQRMGAERVAVSEPAPQRRELNARLGAATIDPAGADDVPAAVRTALDGDPTLVVDAVGSARTLATAFATAPIGATVVLVGMGAPTLELAAYEISTKERSVVGSFCYSAAEFRDTAQWAATAPDALDALIEGRTDLAGGPGAFEALAKGTDPASKVLVLPQGGSR